MVRVSYKYFCRPISGTLHKNKFHKCASWGSFVKTTQRVRLSTSTINQEESGFHASDAKKTARHQIIWILKSIQQSLSA